MVPLIALGPATPFLLLYGERTAWVSEQDCPTALRPGSTAPAEELVGWYGAVRSCRVVAREAHLVSRTDASTVLLLDTAAGTVLLRVDYTSINQRYMSATAVELPASDAPDGMSSADKARLRASTQARSTARLEKWTLIHGDG